MTNMARRSMTKVTYAPIRPSADDVASGTVARRQRAIEKVAYANALKVSAPELASIKSRLNPAGESPTLAALDAIGGVSSRDGWRLLANTPNEAIIAAGRSIAAYRREQRSLPTKTTAEPVAVHAAAQPPARPAIGSISLDAAMALARDSDAAGTGDSTRLGKRVTGIAAETSGNMSDGWHHHTGPADEATPDWTDDLTDGFAEQMQMEPVGSALLALPDELCTATSLAVRDDFQEPASSSDESRWASPRCSS